MTYVLLLTTAVALVLLWLERIRLDRSRRAIPLVITVTGTRGKSTVTRMLASALRADGRRVLSKTTGSEAVVELPDGSVREIDRRGHPSILEQKQVIHLAAKLRVEVAVIEVMSIHRENHLVESHKIIRPDIVLVTNFRVDHTAAAGSTRADMASVIGLDIPPGARAFVLQHESLPAFRAAVAGGGGELMEVVSGADGEVPNSHSTDRPGFIDNCDLVYAACRSLQLDENAIRIGFSSAARDIGSLRAWHYRADGSGPDCVLVSAFAANDPDSTMRIYASVMKVVRPAEGCCVGLLSLRHDRGDRTLQWAEALEMGALRQFSHLYMCGVHAPALERRLKPRRGTTELVVLRRSQPSEITRIVTSELGGGGGVVFGFGNIGGVGKELIAHWSELAEPFDI